MYFRQLERCQRRGATNGEVGEALSSNSDEKKEALKGRFKVGMWARA
jgi:exosome complex RNA-binding protein Csl4